MKPALYSDVERTGNITGESVTMTVDVTAMEHIMGLLTDLYSDPELAVIREYSTNALDSHIEAGNPDPIEVFTPGPLSPFFRIKDRGVGLDAEDIRNIYSKYGASTKRSTNDQVGMLGLGCKSALTYATQFTLVGIKNGTKTVVLISRDSKGRGNMEIVEQLDTNEPNGVEIMIPVKGRNEFIEKANKFFRFWKPGTVLVNDKEPKAPNLTLIKDNIWLAPGDFSDYVVMGNVSYPVKSGILSPQSTYYGNYAIVAYVNIGDVQFTPSREALHYTPHTLDTLRNIREQVDANLHQAIEREISGAQTAKEALEAFQSWGTILRTSRGGYRKPISWRNQEITEIYGNLDNVYIYRIGERNSNKNSTQTVEFRTLKSANTLVVGFKGPLEAKHKTKIRQWINGTGRNTYGMTVVCDKLPGSPWTDHLDTVDWQTIANFKPVRAANNTATKKAVPEWPIVNKQGAIDDKGTIDPTKTLYYVERKRRVYLPRIEFLGDDVQVVAVSANRINSLKTKHPNAIELGTHLTKLAQDALDKLTPSDYAKMRLSSHDQEILKALDAKLLEDPEMIELVRVAQTGQFSQAWRDFQAANKRLDDWNYPKLKLSKLEQGTVINQVDYPLLAMISWWQLRDIRNGHAELYLNAVYNSKREQ